MPDSAVPSAGYQARQYGRKRREFLILPLLVAVSFFPIADIDSPRGGVVHTQPVNLNTLAESLHAQ